MRIIHLKKSDKVYSCNSYLLLGDWNRLEDVNTLIDPGSDGFVMDELERISTGCGKIPVEQVILTHNHFDHCGGVMAVKRRFNSRVLAFTEGPGVDELLSNGEFIKAGDDILEVIHTPGHSSDSICLYAAAAKVLFSGDTQVRITKPGDAYDKEYVNGLERLAAKDITSIYSGHDETICSRARETILTTLSNVTEWSISENNG